MGADGVSGGREEGLDTLFWVEVSKLVLVWGVESEVRG